MSDYRYDRVPNTEGRGDGSPVSQDFPGHARAASNESHISEPDEPVMTQTNVGQENLSAQSGTGRSSHSSADSALHQQSQAQKNDASSTAQLLNNDATSTTQSQVPAETNGEPPEFVDEKVERLHGRERTESSFANRASLPFSPSTHDLTPLSHGTAREYNHARQTHRLWRLSVGECLLTFLICGGYAGILVGYWKKDLIDRDDRHRFNALITGISLLLGVNLTASLRSYAKLLRWLLLAQRYQPLEVFDLILGCDSLWNIIKIIFKAKNLRPGRKRFLPSWSQICALLWLLVNLSITIFVGMVGLNFSLDVNQHLTSTREGSVNVTDWSSLSKKPYYDAIQEIQSYGIRGFPSGYIYTTSLGYWEQVTGQYETAANGTTRYWITSYNPNDILQASISPYFIDSYASCTEFNVTGGNYGNETWFVYEDDTGKSRNVTIPANKVPGPDGLLAMSDTVSDCGPGCTYVDIFMPQTNTTDQVSDEGSSNLGNVTVMSMAKAYECTNTISRLLYNPSLSPSGTVYYSTDDYQLSDPLRSMLAGSIGWDGAGPLPNRTWTFQSYDQTDDVASWPILLYNGVPSATNMSDYVSAFAIKGIVSMDALAVGLPFTQVQGQTPITAQFLAVNWKYVIPLLSGIPAVHLVTLLIVFFLANQAIIKDDSHLSMAKLYYSLLRDNGFDSRGCMLKGEEIVEEIGNPLVAYGWSDGADDVKRRRQQHERGGDDDDGERQRIYHVDVLEKGALEDRIRGGWRRKFPRNVLYDGIGISFRKRRRGTRQEGCEQQQNQYRDFDAKEYF